MYLWIFKKCRIRIFIILYMRKIFCLETEWVQNVHSLKSKSSALSLLDFLQNSDKRISFLFRNVATKEDFNFYINHLNYDSYKAYDMVYLCFHGSESSISLACGAKIDIMDFAKEHMGIFEGKNVHFGCCSTLNIEEEKAKEFKRLTKARMITGYRKDVDFIDSFVFELWLLNVIANHPEYGAARVKSLAVKKMGYYTQKFKFETY